MKLEAVSGVMLTLLLTSMLTLAFNIQSVRAEPKTIIVPDDYPTIQEAINAANPGDTEGLVARWHFDENIGSTAYDSSGNNNNGTIYGAIWTNGVTGSALSFDGSDDYVEVDYHDLFRFEGSQPFTVELWFKREGGFGIGQMLIIRGFDGDPENSNWWLSLGGTNQVGFGYEHDLGTNQVILSDLTIEDRSWHYVAGSWDGIVQRLFLDGVLVASDSSAPPIGVTENRPIRIGNAFSTFTGGDRFHFNGLTDEVRIYNRTLSAEEIFAHFVTVDVTPPTTTHDYDGLWHTTDFIITLTATDDLSGIAETYYKINDEPTKTVSIDGQPYITTESANNTLEYWSVDVADNEELPHKILTGIKLDKTAPTGSIAINNDATYTTSASVTLTLTVTDATSSVSQVRYSNDGMWDTEPWETSSPTKTWTLTSGDGTKTVYYQIKDNAGLVSITYSDTIVLDTNPPTGSITIAEGLVYTNSTSVTLTLSADDATSGVAQMCFSHDNATWTPWETYSTSKTWTLTTGDGIKTVYVQFIDNAGLVSQSYSGTITLDTNPPAIVITSPSFGYEIKSSTITVTWTGSDGTSGISYYKIRLDDYSWIDVGTNTTHTFTGLDDGSHTIEVKAFDNAGLTKQDSVDFIVNTSPLFGPGYTEEAAILATTIIAAIGIALYFFKIRKR